MYTHPSITIFIVEHRDFCNFRPLCSFIIHVFILHRYLVNFVYYTRLRGLTLFIRPTLMTRLFTLANNLFRKPIYHWNFSTSKWKKKKKRSFAIEKNSSAVFLREMSVVSHLGCSLVCAKRGDLLSPCLTAGVELFDARALLICSRVKFKIKSRWGW